MNENTKQSESNCHATVRFYIDENHLMTEWLPDSLENPLDGPSLCQIFNAAGFDSQLLNADQLDTFTQHSLNNHEGEIKLLKIQHAEFEIKVASDKLKASIIYKPTVFGENLTLETVLEYLKNNAFDENFINQDTIADVLQQNQGGTFIFTEGVSPEAGIDSSFRVLFNIDNKKKPGQKSDGSIDHYETREYITVSEGEAVMERIPHTLGVTGTDIFGEEVIATDGKEIAFDVDDTVHINPDNPDQLIAKIKGHPIAKETGVHIDNTLTIDEASLKSGNIDFDGSVEVKGNVLPNVQIKATGDVFVHGMVESATLIAGNDITISAGVLSSKLYDNNKDETFNPECILEAQGTIILKYCNTISASAKKDILIETYSMNSYLKANDELLFGFNKGKGVVIGGESIAGRMITANQIGSDAYVKTTLNLGSLSGLNKIYKKLKNEIKRSENEQSLLQGLLDKIKSKGTPATVGSVVLKKAKKLFDEINKIKSDISGLKHKASRIKKRINSFENATIKVNKNIYSNVLITINDVATTNNRERNETSIHCKDFEIQFN